MLKSIFKAFVGADESRDDLTEQEQQTAISAAAVTATPTAAVVVDSLEELVDVEASEADLEIAEEMHPTETSKKPQPQLPQQHKKHEEPLPVIELLRKVSEPAELDPEDVVKLSQGTLRAQNEAPIFVGEDGKALKFLVPENMTYADELKALVAKYGGKLVTEAADDVIHLGDRTSRPDQLCYSPDLVYHSIAEGQLAFITSFALPVNLKKRARTSFTPEEDMLLVENALTHLDDGHYEPGENLFKLLIEKGLFSYPWTELQERYHELMEEPQFKKKRFDFTTARDRTRSPRKSLTPPKKAQQAAGRTLVEDQKEKIIGALDHDDQEAYHQIDSEVESQRDNKSELGETEGEEGSVKSEAAHQPHLDDYSIDGSIQGSIHGESDSEANEFSLEAVEHTIQKLMSVTKKPRQSVLHAIYVCNGELKVAKDFLLKGPKVVAGKIWSKEEDNIIQSDNLEDMIRLEKRRGKAAVEARMLFIEQCS